MMKFLNTCLLVAFLSAFIIPASLAATPKVSGYNSGHTSEKKTYKYRTSILDSSLDPAKDRRSKVVEIDYRVEIDYVFKFEMSLLMGEPVLVGWLAYKPINIQISHLDQNVLLGLFNETDDLYEKVRVSEFKMLVWFFKNSKGQRAMEKGLRHTFDTGVAWKPYLDQRSADLLNNDGLFKKFRSYNVPGSPNWDNLFDGITDANRAKQLYTDFTSTAGHVKMSPSDFRIDKIEIDTSEVEKYIYNYLQRVEKEVVAKETSGPLQEKNRLEHEVESARQADIRRIAEQEAEAKAQYEQKSFDDQLDDLLELVEETGKPEINKNKSVSATHSKEIARINDLALKIRKANSQLELYSSENRLRILSSFAERKEEIARRGSNYYAKLTLKKESTDTAYNFYTDDHELVLSVPKGKYSGIGDFYEGLCAVKSKDYKWGFIDTTGELVIPPQYSSPYNFKNGITLGIMKGHAYVIDNTGERISSRIDGRYASRFSMNSDYTQVKYSTHEYKGSCDSRKSRFKRKLYDLNGSYLETKHTEWKSDGTLCLQFSSD